MSLQGHLSVWRFDLGGLGFIIYKMVALRSTHLIPAGAAPEDFAQLLRHLQVQRERGVKAIYCS